MYCETLQDLSPGKKATVTQLNLYGGKRRRLLDLGFQPGSELTCLQRASGGSPTVFLVRGTRIALRKSDCENILVNADA